EQYPTDVRMQLALARLEFGPKPAKEVAARLHAALAVLPVGRPEVQVEIADMFLALNERSAARALLDPLATEYAAEAFTCYLRGRLALSAKQWRTACAELEAARPLLVRVPELVKKIDVYLAQCYEQAGNPDWQQAACRRALQIDPLLTEARLSL